MCYIVIGEWVNILAKSRINEWLEGDKLILLEGWAREGLTDEQIAHNMGIGKTTFYDWKQKSPNFANALKKTKEVVDFEVENALFKNAMNGNVTAQIFWLKNRKKMQWRDKVANIENEEENNVINNLVEALNNAKKS